MAAVNPVLSIKILKLNDYVSGPVLFIGLEQTHAYASQKGRVKIFPEVNGGYLIVAKLFTPKLW